MDGLRQIFTTKCNWVGLNWISCGYFAAQIWLFLLLNIPSRIKMPCLFTHCGWGVWPFSAVLQVPPHEFQAVTQIVHAYHLHFLRVTRLVLFIAHKLLAARNYGWRACLGTRSRMSSSKHAVPEVVLRLLSGFLTCNVLSRRSLLSMGTNVVWCGKFILGCCACWIRRATLLC
jgi:hypothetical protein